MSLLDTACARVAISQHATPGRGRGPAAAPADARGGARASSTARRRSASTSPSARPRARRGAGRDRADARRRRGALGGARRSWSAESSSCAPGCAARACRSTRRPRPPAPAEPAMAGRPATPPPRVARAAAAPDRDADLAELRRLMAELAAAQGETPLILPSVDRNAVAAVVQDWTGIPTGRMLTSQTEKALRLAEILSDRVVGQDHAMEMIATPGADQPRRPRRAGEAGRRLPALRPLRRRQDRDGAGAGRDALRRRAEPHHHQHVGVPGGAHRLDCSRARRRATSATARAAC